MDNVARNSAIPPSDPDSLEEADSLGEGSTDDVSTEADDDDDWPAAVDEVLGDDTTDGLQAVRPTATATSGSAAQRRRTNEGEGLVMG